MKVCATGRASEEVQLQAPPRGFFVFVFLSLRFHYWPGHVRIKMRYWVQICATGRASEALRLFLFLSLKFYYWDGLGIENTFFCHL